MWQTKMIAPEQPNPAADRRNASWLDGRGGCQQLGFHTTTLTRLPLSRLESAVAGSGDGGGGGGGSAAATPKRAGPANRSALIRIYGS